MRKYVSSLRTKAEVLGVFRPLPNECTTTTSLPNDAHLLLHVVDGFNAIQNLYLLNTTINLTFALLSYSIQSNYSFDNDRQRRWTYIRQQ